MYTRIAFIAAAAFSCIAAIGPASVGASGQADAALTVRSSQWGRIVFDTRGRALYAFTRDPVGRKSTCSGACAAAWPPYVVRGKLGAGAGIRARLLGTTRRADGRRQLTYRGRPLYYYVGDRRPGVVRCQNVFEFGGLWLVVRPDGRLVR